MLQVDGLPLWCASPNVRLTGGNLHRLPGSRGQLTLIAEIQPPGQHVPMAGVVWWAFALGPTRQAMVLAADGRELLVGDRRFKI